MGYDYYWKDYDGSEIPDDAFKIQQENDNLYIGQVYIHNCGIFIGTIHKGQEFMEVSAYGIRKPAILIKILCAPIEIQTTKFYWLKTKTETYHGDVTLLNQVTGGYDHINNHGFLVIGLVEYGGTLVVGNIQDYDMNKPRMYFTYGGKDFKVEAFEVLVNSPPPVGDKKSS